MQKSQLLFQLGNIVLSNPKILLPEELETVISRGMRRWSTQSAQDDAAGRSPQKRSGREELIQNLKNMRRILISREAGKMSRWIEQSRIRRTWPELPEYRIRRQGIRALLVAFRKADSISQFHRLAPFYVVQNFHRFACNSPSCWSFRINLKTGKGTCTCGSGRMF
jgi:hypothetical protein